MEYNFITTESKDGIATVTFNRPEVLNTMNEAMAAETAAAMQAFGNDGSIRAIIIRGNEKAFCAGIDVKEFAERIDELSQLTDHMKESLKTISNLRKPLIAAASGYVLGIGAEILMCADIVIASDSFRLGLPEASLGLIPGMGVLNKLIQTAGRAKAMEMALCGRAMLAEEAERSGIISRIVPLPDLNAEAFNTAGQIIKNPQFAIEAIKASVHNIFESNSRIEDTNLRNKVLITTEEFRAYISNFNNQPV